MDPYCEIQPSLAMLLIIPECLTHFEPAKDTIPLDPANYRIYIEFTDDQGAVRGSSSVPSIAGTTSVNTT